MKLKGCLIFLLLSLLLSCRDIFTTSRLAAFSKPVDEMTDSELTSYVKDTDLTTLTPEVLSAAESALVANRGDISELDQDDEAAVAQYLEDTALLLAINKEQADVEGLIEVFTSSGDSGTEDILDNILADTDRINNLKEASGYVADAFALDPDSVDDTDLVLGSVGLLSDIIQDDTKAADLAGVADYETSTLDAAGFTATEIEDIQTAKAMLTAADELPDEMASMLEGLLF